MLCSLSLYKAIKKKYPDSHITLVASKTNYTIPFFEINPYIDRVLIYDSSSFKTILNFYKQLRDRKYQIGFVPSTIRLSTTSHIINLLSGAKIRVGVNSIDGVKNNSAFFLNRKDDFNWQNKHQLIRNLEIAKLAGFDLSDEEIAEIKFSFTEDEISLAKKFLKDNFNDSSKKIIAFHPGAGKKENTYPTDKFIQLIKMIYKKFGNHILITSGWTDCLIINKIKSELDKVAIKYTIAHNFPVKKLAAILSMVELYITNDTGTMHIAGFSGTKMISLFGQTNPNEWAPKNKNSFYIRSQTGNVEDIPVDEIINLSAQILNE